MNDIFSFYDILDKIYDILGAIYRALDSIYLFEEFHVSALWILLGLIPAGLIWRAIGGDENFNEDELEEDEEIRRQVEEDWSVDYDDLFEGDEDD